MQLKNPSGIKNITFKKMEKSEIFLEDFREKDSSFNLNIILEGDHTEVKIIGRLSSKKQYTKKLTVKIFLQGASQKVSLDLRGTSENNSFLEFDGGAIIEKNSSECEISISEKIILFDNGKGKCLPILTVKTDQVKKASHSASIAPFTKETLLFCQSKGISKINTENLLKKGFLGSF
jgi:Fe-S cluster assembly scaffold protein SufB